ncbi:3-isopropylmalate dehydratase small subunit [Alteromonas ponticola]|uniref:3-isopropylmalate dehydratase small subunit n=1 Tax=Alteromonas aquimaris TaxID=2998417 RepID=A0ABT3P2F5_9ALTE|nr:3-isopropylmalate dehydratase small subunit [Alteromonas aquimaris]MCW8106944.1 3-isopropylmalate dehydratase small subunit [Alteromonas aquimaris]
MAISKGFNTYIGTACPLNKANVDTDQLIPKQFLTGVTRTGYGRHLFYDWRYLEGDVTKPDPNFVLNKAEHAGAGILLARENFGCGSSREHAPWALADHGFTVIIAASFADIFFNNCINNQILPVSLPLDELDSLFTLVAQKPDTQIRIDLPAQQLTADRLAITFAIPAQAKTRLIRGLDAIDQTLEHESAIHAFEHRMPAWS